MKSALCAPSALLFDAPSKADQMRLTSSSNGSKCPIEQSALLQSDPAAVPDFLVSCKVAIFRPPPRKSIIRHRMDFTNPR